MESISPGELGWSLLEDNEGDVGVGPERGPEVGAEAQILAPTLTVSSPSLLMLSPGLGQKEKRFWEWGRLC